MREILGIVRLGIFGPGSDFLKYLYFREILSNLMTEIFVTILTKLITFFLDVIQRVS